MNSWEKLAPNKFLVPQRWCPFRCDIIPFSLERKRFVGFWGCCSSLGFAQSHLISKSKSRGEKQSLAIAHHLSHQQNWGIWWSHGFYPPKHQWLLLVGYTWSPWNAQVVQNLAMEDHTTVCITTNSLQRNIVVMFDGCGVQPRNPLLVSLGCCLGTQEHLQTLPCSLSSLLSTSTSWSCSNQTQNMSIHIAPATPTPTTLLLIISSSSFNKISTQLFIMREDAWDWDGAN